MLNVHPNLHVAHGIIVYGIQKPRLLVSHFPRDAKQNERSPLGVTESLPMEQVEIVDGPLVSSQLYLYIEGQHAYSRRLSVQLGSMDSIGY